MVTYCKHTECQDEQIIDLWYIAKKVPRLKLVLEKAVNLVAGGMEVRCRKVPRNGAVKAPFPGEEK